MLFLFAVCGTVAVWLWLFPPEGLSDRVRWTGLILSCLVTLLTGWATAATVDRMNEARRGAMRQYRRSERLKRELIRHVQGEEPRTL